MSHGATEYEPVRSDLLSIDQAAKRLGISTRWVFRLLERRELPYVQLGGRRKIEPTALEEYVAARRIPAKAGP